jgi:hypothetical protein
MAIDDELTLELETPVFKAEAVSRRAYIPTGEIRVKKSGEEKQVLIPIRIRNIVLVHKASGEMMKFPFTCRKGAGSFGDSRKPAMADFQRWSIKGMRGELARMLGEENAERLINICLC